MCVCVCVSVSGGSGMVGGGTRLVMYDLRTLYCVCMITSGCNWGAAAEKGEQLGLAA